MSEEPIQIPYATPVPRSPSKGWAASALLFGGLGLVFLGGCFMIGVLISWHPALFNNVSAAPDIPIAILLLILALACFLGAVWLIILGVSSLLRILRA